MVYSPSVDIFCSVIDNFGDIGVCWRLAQQLSSEYHLQTRLFVDRVDVASRFIPADYTGVDVIEWGEQIDYMSAADIVVEAFACPLPEHVMAVIAKQRSIWIDLEYLTAEDWALGCHAIPSKHPQYKIEKTLFFPGFEEKTGGLIRENDLIQRRDRFLSDENEQNEWRLSHKLPKIDRNSLDISLFCYPTSINQEFFEGLASLGQQVRLFYPDKLVSTGFLNGLTPNLEAYTFPFLPQKDYDYLLWTCDINYVRGEDSFVRAQWAGKPFYWSIYKQDKFAHIVKLQAFLEKMRPFFETESFERLANFHLLWNEGGDLHAGRLKNSVVETLSCFANLQKGAKQWSDYLIQQTNLAERLLAFCANHQVRK